MDPRPPWPTLFPYTTLFRSLKKTGGECGPKFAAAAKEYAALAEAQPAATAKVDLLRRAAAMYRQAGDADAALAAVEQAVDRKSTRLNSSHPSISYAVFCLKK